MWATDTVTKGRVQGATGQGAQPPWEQLAQGRQGHLKGYQTGEGLDVFSGTPATTLPRARGLGQPEGSRNRAFARMEGDALLAHVRSSLQLLGNFPVHHNLQLLIKEVPQIYKFLFTMHWRLSGNSRIIP